MLKLEIDKHLFPINNLKITDLWLKIISALLLFRV